jgi:hypothetical protein
MNQSYLPSTEGELITWLGNFSSKLDTYGAALGLDAQKIAELKAMIASIIASINNVTEKLADYQMAVQAKDSTKKTGLDVLRTSIAAFKTNAGYNEILGEAFGIIGSTTAGSEKPTISVSKVPQGIAIKFVKSDFEGVHIYRRKKGEAEFQFIRHVSHSPFVDTSITKAGIAAYEYRAIGVIADEETGFPSDTVEIAFGG